MVEQSKEQRRARRRRRAARREQAAKAAETVQNAGLLSGSGLTAEDITSQDRALRAAFPYMDNAETDAYPQAPAADAPQLENTTSPAPLILSQAIEQPAPPPDQWSQLGPMPVQPQQMAQNLIITASRRNPVHAAFDVLRARLVQALRDNNWKRVAITSPTRDCGKTFVSVNLSVALSRYENCRTLLLDMDMRNPSVAKTLGLRDVGSIGAYLRGEITTQDHFFKFDENTLKLGDNLAIAMNDKVEAFASELMQQPETHQRLATMEDELHPDIILFDLPPALANDDVIAFKNQFDGVLIVIDGTRTTGAEVREVMRRLGDDVPLLGVVLNKAEDATGDEYGY